MDRPHRAPPAALLALAVALAASAAASARDVVLNAQGEFLDAYLVNGAAFPPRVVFIDPDPPAPDDPNGPPPRVGRHVNGPLCFFPPKFRHTGYFAIADDTYREACLDRTPPQARCAATRASPLWVGRDPDGWAIFRRSGKWTRGHIHTAWDFSGPPPQGNIDPQGCAFDAQGNFWGVDVGHGSAKEHDGSLVVFFPGPRKRYREYCFVDEALAAPGMPAMDDAGNLYVPEPAALRVTRFSPPFPTSPADCANPKRLVTMPPTKTTFLAAGAGGAFTFAGIVRLPSGHFFVGSVLAPPVVNEYDASGLFVRTVVPAGIPGNPLGLAVGTDGTLYYSELSLDPTTLDTRCGRVSMVRFDAAGRSGAPQVLGRNLAFPDGVTVVDSSRFRLDFGKLPPAVEQPPSACGGE